MADTFSIPWWEKDYGICYGDRKIDSRLENLPDFLI